jgi:hypothetical protein
VLCQKRKKERRIMSEWPPALIEQVLDEMYAKAIKDGVPVFEDYPPDSDRGELEETFRDEPQ